MKKPKFQYVPQRDNNDCVIACLSMVTGKSYEDIDFDFHRPNEKTGIRTSAVIEYLENCGLYVITKQLDAFVDFQRSNKLMVLPFADIHLLQCKLYANKSDYHCTVMTKTGKHYNPNPNDPEANPIKKYYMIVNTLGIYYE